MGKLKKYAIVFINKTDNDKKEQILRYYDTLEEACEDLVCYVETADENSHVLDTETDEKYYLEEVLEIIGINLEDDESPIYMVVLFDGEFETYEYFSTEEEAEEYVKNEEFSVAIVKVNLREEEVIWTKDEDDLIDHESFRTKQFAKNINSLGGVELTPEMDDIVEEYAKGRISYKEAVHLVKEKINERNT